MKLTTLFSSKPWSVDLASLILRIFMGGYMAYSHGYGKYMQWDELKLDFAEPFGMSPAVAAALTIFAEFFCGILLVVGLFTRVASIPLIICMAVAAFNIHAGDPLADREGAFTYLAAFTSIFFIGGGRFSLDALLFKK